MAARAVAALAVAGVLGVAVGSATQGGDGEAMPFRPKILEPKILEPRK